MIKIIYNAITGETSYEEVEEVEFTQNQPTEIIPSLEERVSTVEKEQEQIVDIFAEILGV